MTTQTIVAVIGACAIARESPKWRLGQGIRRCYTTPAKVPPPTQAIANINQQLGKRVTAGAGMLACDQYSVYDTAKAWGRMPVLNRR